MERSREIHAQTNDIELSVKVCKRAERKYLIRNCRCRLLMSELKRQKRARPPSGHTTLRLRWKKGGWTYRKV